MKHRISALALVGICAFAGSTQAQQPAPAAPADDCGKIQSLLAARQTMVSKFTGAAKGKKMTATAACASLGNIVSNGTRLLTLMEPNKDWCRIPDDFIAGIKADAERSQTLRGQACRAASQEAALRRRAQAAQQQQQGGNAFGGADKVTGGAWRVPAGAL